MKIKEEKNPYNTNVWSKMSIVNKRKAIAWDVIWNLKTGVIAARQGSYCGLYAAIFEDSQKHILNNFSKRNPCESCAMGSMMTVDILNRNSFKGIFTDKDIEKRFAKIFSKFQLRLIETAFEVEVVSHYMLDKDADIRYKAMNFGRKYLNSNNRLKAIMNNIIKDEKGLFLGIDFKN